MVVPPAIRAELRAHAAEEAPNECCGLIVLRDGVAYLQAGGGITSDSDPAAEHQECLNKLGALEAAIELAEQEQRR